MVLTAKVVGLFELLRENGTLRFRINTNNPSPISVKARVAGSGTDVTSVIVKLPPTRVAMARSMRAVAPEPGLFVATC